MLLFLILGHYGLFDAPIEFKTIKSPPLWGRRALKKYEI